MDSILLLLVMASNSSPVQGGGQSYEALKVLVDRIKNPVGKRDATISWSSFVN
jgi:hypothetical protein